MARVGKDTTSTYGAAVSVFGVSELPFMAAKHAAIADPGAPCS